LRPGTLTDGPSGQVEFGKTKSYRGGVSRSSVADIIALLLYNEGLRTGWLDLLDGDEDPAKAVDRVVKDGVDVAEGEPVFKKAHSQL
jgi:hypothetical protein